MGWAHSIVASAGLGVLQQDGCGLGAVHLVEHRVGPGLIMLACHPTHVRQDVLGLGDASE